MKITSYSFDDLPFPKLFKNYINQDPALLSFYDTNPFAPPEVENKISNYTYKGDRKVLGAFLREYNAQFGRFPGVEESIAKLEKENALTLVTGQQLTLFGGPMFTIYKILTTIKKAQEFEEKHNRPVVPVFWLADEDHDYEEAAQLNLQVSDEIKNYFYEKEWEAEARVYDIPFKDGIESLIEEVRKSQPETDFTSELWPFLKEGYRKGETFGMAFGKLILNLFSTHGVILCGTNSQKAKELTREIFTESVLNKNALFDTLNDQTAALEKEGYSGQVQVNRSNLFIIDEKGNRNKLTTENEIWLDESNGVQYTDEELISEINRAPEKFSPNVFLRPLLQSKLLPDAAYIAGPGEVAYYAQLKPLYASFNLQMPIIIPRMSATIMESSVERQFKKLPFELEDYSQRIEDMEHQYIKRSDAPDIEHIFAMWTRNIEEASAESIQKIQEIDSTLQGTAEKAKSHFLNDLNKVKGKVYRAVKKQEEIQISRISKVQNRLFPNRNLQEREIAFIYFMNKYGIRIWDELLENLESLTVDTHKVIHL